MFTALLSFLGGNVFRLMFGEVVSYLNKRQAHSFEIERLKLQADLDAAQHVRNLDAIRTELAAELAWIDANVSSRSTPGDIFAAV